MRIHVKELNHCEFEAILTNEDLKSIISDHLQNAKELKASNGNHIEIKPPLRPALKIRFVKDAYSGTTAVVRWNESNN